jgi:hypothetical protein
MKKYYVESSSIGISYMQYINGRRCRLVIICVEAAFYSGYRRKDKKRDRSNRKTRKKT